MATETKVLTHRQQTARVKRAMTVGQHYTLHLFMRKWESADTGDAVVLKNCGIERKDVVVTAGDDTIDGLGLLNSILKKNRPNFIDAAIFSGVHLVHAECCKEKMPV